MAQSEPSIRSCQRNIMFSRAIGSLFASPPSARVSSALELITRGYKKHRVNRPNLAQDVDCNTLDTLLQRATTPLACALPILRYSNALNPAQTSSMLQRLPRMERLYAHRMAPKGEANSVASRPEAAAWPSEERQALRNLLSVLQKRFSVVMTDCTPEQLQSSLWGLAMAYTRCVNGGTRERQEWV